MQVLDKVDRTASLHEMLKWMADRPVAKFSSYEAAVERWHEATESRAQALKQTESASARSGSNYVLYDQTVGMALFCCC
jgi:hypothetical protein